jgi:tellurite resistance protein
MPSFWDKVRRNADAARDELAKRASRFNNRAFLEGVLAAAALIVLADGKLDDSEIDGTIRFLDSHPALAGWSSDEKATLFRDYAAKAADQFSKIQLAGKISAQKSNAEAATTLIELALALANADGEFAQKEKDVVVRICGYLNLDSSQYV